MRSFRRLISVFMLLLLVSAALFAGAKPEAAAGGGKTYNVTFSSIAGGIYGLPYYIAREEGWFTKAGLNVKEVFFSNGPVQVEALASNGWDIGVTGVGGVLSGVLGYDAVLLGPTNTDDGIQSLFTRSNSDIVAAGTGHNSIDPRIYGTADTWRGKKIICNVGTTWQYHAIKVLSGFNLSPTDVQFISMDMATAGSAFRAGEGDAATLGAQAGLTMMKDKDFTMVSTGPWAKLDLMINWISTKNVLADPEKREAILLFWDVYYKSLDWIKNNSNAAIDLLVDYNAEMGTSLDRGSAEYYLTLDPYFTMQEGVDMMVNKAPGKNHSVMEERLIGVLQFFIDTGSRQKGDVEKFVGHVDPSMMQEFLKRSK